MNTLKELGDQWEREALAGVMGKRDRIARSAALCKEGGEYGAQMLRIVAMYDRMIAAASAQPVSAGLAVEAPKIAPELRPLIMHAIGLLGLRPIGSMQRVASELQMALDDKDIPASEPPSQAWMQVADIAAQRDSQPDHIAAGEMVADIPPGCEMARGWGVNVTIYGQPILHIGEDCLSGLADLDPWRSTIRECAEHLMAFIGTESAGQPVEETPADARDAARYRILRRHVAPADLAASMGVPRSDIGTLESIEDRIDSMCDAAIAASKEASLSQEPQ